MGTLVLITGESGTGKSASMRTFKGGELSVFNVSTKPLPFRNKGDEKITVINVTGYEELQKKLELAKNKSIVIDDAQYLMAFEYFGAVEERGYEKYTRMGKNFYSVVKQASNMDNDKIIYFLMHIERDADGYERAKTLGKLLEEKLTLEGLFTISLKSIIKDDGTGSLSYYFRTKGTGFDRVKTPIGMFEEEYIENDLKKVDRAIREYYGLSENERETDERFKKKKKESVDA